MKTLRSYLRILGVVAAFASGGARADLIVMIDDSESSPAMHGAQAAEFIATVAPHIARHIAHQPLGSRLAMFYVGDHASIDAPLLDKTIQRVATASGDTAKAYAASFPRYFQAQLGERRIKPPATQSHLSAAIADARALVAEGRPCEMVLLSDLAEWDRTGVQYPRDWRKPLPKIAGLSLLGCSVSVYGAGQGMAPKPAEAIQRHWAAWLRDAGAEPVTIQRF